jgi:HEAT repeat protein
MLTVICNPNPASARAGRVRIVSLVSLLCALSVSLAALSPAWAATESSPIDVQQLGATVIDTTQVDRTRLESAEILASSPDPRAVEYLFTAIRDPATRPLVRGALTESLRLSPRREPVATFAAERLADPAETTEVRAAAAQVLGVFRLPRSETVVRDHLSDPVPAIRLAARGALLAFDLAVAERVEVLAAILSDRDQPGIARANAAHGLGATHDSLARPALRAALKEEMSDLPEPANVGEVMERLSTLKGVVPIAAARALGELGDPAAAADLLTAAERPEVLLRVTVFESLARLKSDESVPAARRALAEDKDQRVRRWAVVLLKELKNPETLPDLRRALEQDADPGVRLQVVQALEAMDDRASLETIRTALEKEELKEVRTVMEQALAALSTQPVVAGATANN